MITPLPMPDELDRSYLGRLIRMNGLRSEKDAMSLIGQWARTSEFPHRKLTRIELLSLAADMDLPEFACRHTTLPLRRSITSYRSDMAHGSIANQSMLRLTGMRVARPGAYFCVDCISTDQETSGMSYWRRDHQLPGVSMCSKHFKPLRYVDNNEAFLKAPSHFISNSNVVDEMWATSMQKNPGIQKFLAISRGLLGNHKPLDVKSVRVLLCKHTNAKGWSTKNGKCNKPLLSDQVAMAFPREWLSTVFLVLVDKKPGVKMHQMDGVLYLSTSASSVIPYILACCLLFNSADEALQALLMPSIDITKPRQRSTPPPVDANELRGAYIRAKGQHALVLTEMSADNRMVLIKLRGLGLPNLSSINQQSALVAATSFFVDKKSSAESADLGGIPLETLEDFIRQGGSELAATLLEIRAPQRGPGTGVLRVRPLTPHEAVATIG